MKHPLLASLLFTLTTGCSVQFVDPSRMPVYDYSDRDFYDRPYAPSPSYGATLAGPVETTTVYRLEYQEGTQWVVQRVYSSEGQALQALAVMGKKGRLWRLILSESNNSLVVGVFRM